MFHSVYESHFSRYYDALFCDDESTQQIVSALNSCLPDVGRAMELGIGTGRVALPLARQGHDVFGIDISPAMLGHLEGKMMTPPHPGNLAWRVGDMTDASDTPLEEYDLVYSTTGSIACTGSLDEQLRVVENALTSVRPGGTVVIETFSYAMKAILPPSPEESHHHVDLTSQDGTSLSVDMYMGVDEKTDVLTNRYVIERGGAHESFVERVQLIEDDALVKHALNWGPVPVASTHTFSSWDFTGADVTPSGMTISVISRAT